MSPYHEILYATLSLNVIAIAYRCQWHCFIFPGKRRTPLEDANGDNDPSMRARHRRLLYGRYLPVYLAAVVADWLQGPYKYAVYSGYGYDSTAIAILFVAGFGSGMILGSLTGSLADSFGRRRMVIVYCVVYMFSCLAKHFRPFWILLLGRVLGGISTSLLYSVFDAWLIRSHVTHNIETDTYLSTSFSAANFGSSVVAILSGLIANWVVGRPDDAEKKLRPLFWEAAKRWEIEQSSTDRSPLSVDDERWNVAILYQGGGIRAFDLALLPLVLCVVMALGLWDENFGTDRDTTSQQKNKPKLHMVSTLRSATLTIWHSPPIFSLCVIQSLFEGSMYVFILLWTPALRELEKDPDGPPLGLVFATFMVCCMLGTSAFSILTSRNVPPARSLVIFLFLASASCFVVAATSDATSCYIAMLVFEFCVGAYYPAMSTQKGNIIAENQRAAIYSVFRLPLNAVVLLNLYVTSHGFRQSFLICAAMLGASTVFQLRIPVRDSGSNMWSLV